VEHDPVTLFERAASNASALSATVTDDQLALPTPCSEWTVGDLLDHMVGGTSYLLGALSGDTAGDPPDRATYRSRVEQCVTALRQPGVLERRCMSPAGFEWSIAEATAGTFMDQLVHTWDLATAIGADPTLDPELAEVCAAMFLPHMPDIGRQAGIVGPAVPVPAGATAQARLLGAMGRQP
jgi:uncharacterized protein (TIGR03086 family)